jgi:hypothetical protein
MNNETTERQNLIAAALIGALAFAATGTYAKDIDTQDLCRAV